MSFFTEYTIPPRRTVFVTETLFRIALFYSVSTLAFGLTSLFEAPWAAAYDDELPLVLARDGSIFILMSVWFGALAGFFQEQSYGATCPASWARFFLFLQFALFGWAMWPLAQAW